MNFSEKINFLMSENGQTLRVLSSNLNISHSTVGDWISKGRKPHKTQLPKVSQFFGVTVRCLLDDSLPIEYEGKNESIKPNIVAELREQIKRLEIALQNMHLSNKNLWAEIEGIREIVGKNKKKSLQQQKMIDKILSDGDKIVSENRKNINKKRV